LTEAYVSEGGQLLIVSVDYWRRLFAENLPETDVFAKSADVAGLASFI